VIEKYDLSGFNVEDEHCQDDQKPAAISTKHPSVSQLAISHKNPLAHLRMERMMMTLVLIIRNLQPRLKRGC
jgi:hypothetical protein